jgi:mono/diheme cytochrome c family protein
MKAVMKLRMIVPILFAAMLLFSCNNKPQAEVSSASKEVAPIFHGHQLFEQSCQPCHGEDGAAGRGGAANLRTLKADSVQMVQTINTGKHNMPGFGQQFSAEEIHQVYLYAKSLHE